jgi:hypothetical protein
MRAEALLALKRLGYQGKGDVTVISDGDAKVYQIKRESRSFSDLPYAKNVSDLSSVIHDWKA